MLPQFSHPLSPTLHDAFWHILQQNFRFQAQAWQPLWLNGIQLGYLNTKWQQQLSQDWQHTQHTDTHGLHLTTANWQDMGQALQQLARHWHDSGLFHGWRNETFDVYDPHQHFLFTLERSAFRPLGLHSHAIHLNGITHTPQGWRFWIGRRSPHKAVDPNKLDNLVGGGISSGESVQQAMIREGWEEAGLPETLLQPLSCHSRRTSLRTVARGLHHECLHIFDLVLPHTIQPINQDGEVAEFLLMDITELSEAMYQEQLMHDAFLALLDLFARVGLLHHSHPLTQYLHTTTK